MKEEITAKWARETAENRLGKIAEGQLDTCLQKIKEAVEANLFYTSFYFTPEDRVAKELEKRGFQIKMNYAPPYSDDDDGFSIYW